MTRKHFCPWLALATVCFLGVAARGQSRLGVQPDGRPDVVMPDLLKFPEPQYANGIGLEHELYFDGVRFQSRFYFPQLQSYLIAVGPNTFKWRDFAGRAWRLAPDVPLHDSTGGTWVLRRVSKGSFRIESESGKEFYHYVGCMPFTVVNSSGTYRFTYTAGQLTRIDRVTPQREQLVSLEYNLEGGLRRIYAAEAIIEVQTDAKLKLRSCVVLGAQPAAYTFQYRSDLLYEAKWPSGQLGPLTWGESTRRNVNPAEPRPPVVVANKEVEFRFSEQGSIIRGRFRDARHRKAGAWEYDRASGVVTTAEEK